MYVKGKVNGGGGGSVTTTTLWTNSDPTVAFAAQYVELSQSMTNFDYIRITFRYTTANATEYINIVTPLELSDTTNTTFKFKAQ